MDYHADGSVRDLRLEIDLHSVRMNTLLNRMPGLAPSSPGLDHSDAHAALRRMLDPEKPTTVVLLDDTAGAGMPTAESVIAACLSRMLYERQLGAKEEEEKLACCARHITHVESTRILIHLFEFRA